MEPGTLLFSLLSQDVTIAALLPHVRLGSPETKIYPVIAPQPSPRPYVTYQLISRVPEAGSSATCRLGDVARVQLSIFADSYAELGTLTEAFRAVLDYAEPEPGVYLEIAGQQDHEQPGALCLFRSLDFSVELP